MNRRLLVDLEALTANYQLFRAAARRPSATTGAVVKADAYGLGAIAVASRLELAGCADFFVATVEEGRSLRSGLGEGSRIFVFEGPDDSSAAELAAANLIPVLNHEAQLESWRPFADRPVAVHVDTGMSRLGFPHDIQGALFAGFQVELLLTHLSCADDAEHPQNALQLMRFDAVRRQFPGVVTSIGNSAGWLTDGSSQGELGRPGVALYGGNPFADRDNPCQPVAALQGRVLQVKQLAAGESIGYGATSRTSIPTTIAVVGIGYADGVPRHLSGIGAMVLKGQRCPILGRVSMDMTVVDVGAVAGAEVGDWVECFGSVMPIDEVAALAGTIAYELLTGVGSRVQRQYRPLGD